MWEYHLVDVEALAAGWLAAGHDWSQGPPVGDRATPPWSSEELSRAVGVDPDDFDRHTALGDARWAAAIYDAVLAPLGGRRIIEHDGAVGYGTGFPEFWLGPVAEPERGLAREAHLAFTAPDRATVRAFVEATIPGVAGARVTSWPARDDPSLSCRSRGSSEA